MPIYLVFSAFTSRPIKHCTVSVGIGGVAPRMLNPGIRSWVVNFPYYVPYPIANIAVPIGQGVRRGCECHGGGKILTRVGRDIVPASYVISESPF
jgi:hypothetical protein